MKAGALHLKSMPEILEQIKDWPDEAKRALLESINRMLNTKKKPAKKKGSSLDAFGMWQGDGTAEELAKSIRDARHFREKDLDW